MSSYHLMVVAATSSTIVALVIMCLATSCCVYFCVLSDERRNNLARYLVCLRPNVTNEFDLNTFNRIPGSSINYGRTG